MQAKNMWGFRRVSRMKDLRVKHRAGYLAGLQLRIDDFHSVSAMLLRKSSVSKRHGWWCEQERNQGWYLFMPAHSAPRVYLAGPEVFLPDALKVLKEKADLARVAGFDPVTPLDNESLAAGSPFDKGLAIYRANLRLMDGCDLIIANLTPFRGVGADPGTAFELGYMAARGARIAAYTNRATPHFERIRDQHYQGQITQDPAGEYRGPDGLVLENFDMFDNLMLAGAIAEGSGILVTHEVEDTRLLYRDLTAFRRCLASFQDTEEQSALFGTAE